MRLKWRLIVPIGLALAIVSFLIRLLDLPFGLHTIFVVILLFISLLWTGKGDISLSLLASLLSVLALILYESLSLSILMPLLGITSDNLLTDSVLRIFLGEPQVILIFLSAYFVNRLLHKRK